MYHPDYSQLTVYLAGCDGQRISLTFSQLEEIVRGLRTEVESRDGITAIWRSASRQLVE